MGPKHFHLFLTIITLLTIAVTAIYTRYHYLGPHTRYDLWQDEYQTMIERGGWIPEELAGKDA